MLSPDSDPHSKPQLPSLAKHVSAFSDPDGKYSAASISSNLSALGSTGTGVKGLLINLFNSVNSGKCPFGGVKFEQGKDGTYGHTLHMGTARVWNADGSINGQNLDKLMNYCTETHPVTSINIVLKNKLMDYISKCQSQEVAEPGTGRYVSWKPLSRIAQHQAATQAWGEVFVSFKSGEVNNQPYLTADMFKLFLVDTPEAVKMTMAERAGTPYEPTSYGTSVAPAR